MAEVDSIMRLLLWTTELLISTPLGLLALEILCVYAWKELVGVVADKVSCTGF